MADRVAGFLVLSTFAFGTFVCCLRIGARCSVATGNLEVVLVAHFPLSCAVSCTLVAVASVCTLGSIALVCTLGSACLSCCSVTLGIGVGLCMFSMRRCRSLISCSCFAVTIGLHLRTLARSAMAFMILLACVSNGLVMFLCLKCTMSDNRSLWVDLM